MLRSAGTEDPDLQSGPGRPGDPRSAGRRTGTGTGSTGSSTHGRPRWTLDGVPAPRSHRGQRPAPLTAFRCRTRPAEDQDGVVHRNSARKWPFRLNNSVLILTDAVAARRRTRRPQAADESACKPGVVTDWTLERRRRSTRRLTCDFRVGRRWNRRARFGSSADHLRTSVRPLRDGDCGRRVP